MAGLLSDEEFENHPAFARTGGPYWDPTYGLPEVWAPPPEDLALKLGAAANPAMQILLAPLSPPVIQVSGRRIAEHGARLGEAAMGRVGEAAAGAVAGVTEGATSRAVRGRSNRRVGTTGIQDVPGEAVPPRGTPQEQPAAAASPATAPDAAIQPTQASPGAVPPGTAPDASLHVATPEPHSGPAAAAGDGSGLRPDADATGYLSVPRLPPDQLIQADILSHRVMLGRRIQKSLLDRLRFWPRPEDSVLRAPVPGRHLPGVEQRVGSDLERLRSGPDRPGQNSGPAPSNRLAAVTTDAGRIVDRVVRDIDADVVRLMRGEAVEGTDETQHLAARAGQFFNLRPFYDALVELGFTPNEARRRVEQEARAIAATSPSTNTTHNQLNAALLQNLQARGIAIDEKAIRRLTGYGAGYPMLYGLHPNLYGDMMRGAATLERAPKTGIFARNLGGDRSALPVDVHNFRATNMIFNDLNPGQLPRGAFASDDAFRRYTDAYRAGPDGSVARGMADEELRGVLARGPGGRRANGRTLRDDYLVYNDITTQVAQRLGVSPAEAQALMWFRYGNRTGLGSPPLTATQILDQRISVTAQILGIPPREVLALYARNAIPLAGVGGIAGMGPLQGLLDPEKDARR